MPTAAAPRRSTAPTRTQTMTRFTEHAATVRYRADVMDGHAIRDVYVAKDALEALGNPESISLTIQPHTPTT